MYERAKYYRSKFIRNGIAGFAMSAFLIYSSVNSGKSFGAAKILFPIVSVAWLYFGLQINRKLKSKDETKEKVEIAGGRISFKQIEHILSALLVVVIFLGVRHVQYANYLAVPILVAYIWWLMSQMKLLNNYFNH
jgi:hypothetical protein